MKTIKLNRFLAAGMGIVLSLGLMTGCGDGQKTVDTRALVNSLVTEISYEQELEELTRTEISNYMDLEDGVEVIMYMSGGSTAEEVAVFTAADADTASSMKENVKVFLEDQRTSFEDYIPEEAKRIDDAVLEQNGNYVVLCVSGDSSKAESIINQAFGK